MSHKLKTRLFIPDSLHPDAEVTLEDSQAHYLLHTLRAAPGDAVALFNGTDGEWLAVVEEVRKKGLRLRVQSLLSSHKPPPDIWLLFAPVKNEKIDYTVKRAVELGVAELHPVLTRRTVVTRVNLERLQANAVEAAQQCGRMEVPPVHEPLALEKRLGSWPEERTLLYCDESGSGAPLKNLLPALTSRSYALLIGPEGGFAPEEQTILARLPFVRPVSLGPRILRAETAALAALANLQAWVGDWDEKPRFEQKEPE